MSLVKCPSCDGKGVMWIIPALSFEHGWMPGCEIGMPGSEYNQVTGILNKHIEPTREDYEKLVARTKEIWRAYCHYYDHFRNAKRENTEKGKTP